MFNGLRCLSSLWIVPFIIKNIHLCFTEKKKKKDVLNKSCWNQCHDPTPSLCRWSDWGSEIQMMDFQPGFGLNRCKLWSIIIFQKWPQSYFNSHTVFPNFAYCHQNVRSVSHPHGPGQAFDCLNEQNTVGVMLHEFQGSIIKGEGLLPGSLALLLYLFRHLWSPELPNKKSGYP